LKDNHNQLVADDHCVIPGERALAINPRSVGAMVGLARVDAGVGLGCFADDRRAHLAAAEATLVKALSLAPNYAGAHLVLGAVQIHTNRAAQGMAESKRALALDHNLASAHAQIGLAKSRRR
jgi:tetratricopeptide (TPR) repeat protein